MHGPHTTEGISGASGWIKSLVALQQKIARYWLLIAMGSGLILGLAGCSEPVSYENKTQASQSESGESAPVPANKFVERKVRVNLSAGTNMAVAVHPNGADRVISLQGTLFLLTADGLVESLTDPYYDAREPQFSPDGKAVVFHGYRNGTWDIWRVDIASKKLTALTNDAFDDREPNFTPDGNAVLFSSDRPGNQDSVSENSANKKTDGYNIWQLDLTNNNLSQLTNSAANTSSPSMSALGMIAFAEQNGREGRLNVMGTLPSDTPPITLIVEPGIISGVQWSPEGERLSYQVLGPAGAQMKVTKVGKGQSPHPVAEEAETISAPGSDVFPFRAQWLDERALVYTENGKVVRTDRKSPSAEVWPFSVEVELTRHDYERRKRDYSATRRTVLGITSPIISNDGQTLYFTALGDIWRWRPMLRQANQITDDAYADNSPTLSPDNSTIAFVSDRSGRVGLHTVDVESKEVQQLPVQANQISAPAWSPDGAKLAFFVDVPGNPLGAQLTIWDKATNTTKRLLKPMPMQPISWSSDAGSIAVTRLNTYSTRYREGVYELVVAAVDGSGEHTIAPSEHKSITYAGLTPDGAMSYVEGGRLLRLELDNQLKALEAAAPITEELTDMPNWSSNGEFLVYLSGKSLKRLEVASGAVEDITPSLSYSLERPEDTYVIRAGRVFTGTDKSYRTNVDIWVEGNRIAKVEDFANTGDVPVIEMLDKTVVPGLFEMHAHMGETSEVQGRVWLSYGVTTVRDPGSNPYVAKERQEAWDSGRRIGPRTHVTGYLTDGNRVFYSIAEGIVSEQHLQESLQRTKDLELDFIKTYVRLPDHWQKKVVDFAHNLGIPVSSHELYPAVAHGMDHVEHIGGTSRRGYMPKVSRLGYSYQDVIDLVSKSGMGLTATAVLPGFADIVNEEPDWFETPQFETFYGAAAKQSYTLMAKSFGAAVGATAKANGRLLAALAANDALLVTGTDAPFVPYGAGLHAEFRLYARAGVSPLDILRQATIKSAQAAGVDAELGTLEAGKLADFVVVDGDPLRDIRDLDRVVMTVKNGQAHTLDDLLLRAAPNADTNETDIIEAITAEAENN